MEAEVNGEWPLWGKPWHLFWNIKKLYSYVRPTKDLQANVHPAHWLRIMVAETCEPGSQPSDIPWCWLVKKISHNGLWYSKTPWCRHSETSLAASNSHGLFVWNNSWAVYGTAGQIRVLGICNDSRPFLPTTKSLPPHPSIPWTKRIIKQIDAPHHPDHPGIYLINKTCKKKTFPNLQQSTIPPTQDVFAKVLPVSTWHLCVVFSKSSMTLWKLEYHIFTAKDGDCFNNHYSWR